MEELLRTILLRHKNKRVHISDIDAALKADGISLFADPEQQKQFIDVIRMYIDLGVLKPLKNAIPLQQYGRLPNRYTIARESIAEDGASLSREHLDELLSLSPPIDIDYYATHSEHYARDREYILRINDLIRQCDSEELTANERSYLLFGDEKAITMPREASVDGDIILRNLKLTLRDIKAKRVFEPFVSIQKNFYAHEGVSQRSVLIVENKDTFWTLQNAVMSGGIAGVHLVVYGEGNAILKKFEYMQTIGGTPEDEYFYFGDIDQEGIYIYNRLRERYLEYDIKPTVSLYTYLLSKVGAEKAQPLRRSRNIKTVSLSPFIDFFDQSAGAAIRRIIQEQKYLPQEVLNKTDIRSVGHFGIY
ncbi:Wadjet anti-phage system protein JetD domain-containing protein [Methanoculleus sp. UBA303]|jgi:hypothetical protein|uniref:Wadjet anti-phage system protein JetD domain-containing protein n=1 Tax=Methanoculleus sp. UBA303 TaxID=1915497 RepID=UPI0025F9886D|nr:Wadjet anti-phage system protein JetD domain-containing protein [Methanoculleus sp. UBA303]